MKKIYTFINRGLYYRRSSSPLDRRSGSLNVKKRHLSGKQMKSLGVRFNDLSDF